MPTDKSDRNVHAFTLPCANEGCGSVFSFAGGTVSDFLAAFEQAHQQGWLCLVKSVLDMTCPICNRRPRAIQYHQVMRRRLLKQQEWKRDIVVFAWAAMADIRDDEYLRTYDMPMWLDALLGEETASSVDRVRQALEHMHSNLGRYSDLPNAAHAARLAGSAVGRT